MSSSLRETRQPRPDAPLRAAATMLAALLFTGSSLAQTGGAGDALLAVESNRAQIVDLLVQRFGPALARAGLGEAALRVQLESLRADQLLAASLVQDLAALDLATPPGGDPLQRYVAVEPTRARLFVPASDALAYVVRTDGALVVLTPIELAALRSGPPRPDTVVGYFVPGTLLIHSTIDAPRTKDGSGTGLDSWIGFTGGGNQATAQGSAVMAGLNNTASGPVSAVISGNTNVASGQGALVGGGDQHFAQGNYSVIVGGYGNWTASPDAVIVGGAFNVNGGLRSVIGSGARNKVATGASLSVIGGGGRDTDVSSGGAAGMHERDNVAFSKWTFIGGGAGNRAGQGTIGGDLNYQLAAVVGGYRNLAQGQGSFIGGGACNIASGNTSVVAGGGQASIAAPCTQGNTAGGGYAFIGAGQSNTANEFGSVAGGLSNTATGQYASIGGGQGNVASGLWSAIAGGQQNGTAGGRASVLGGFGNSASATHATVGGGSTNLASGIGSTVAGGEMNTASGTNSMVLGGFDNLASGDYAAAFGRNAKTRTEGGTVSHGAFVWADGTNANFYATGDNSFNVRATGGARFVAGLDGNGNPTYTCSMSNGIAWACSSDRAVKRNLVPVDARATLARLLALPVYRWQPRDGPNREVLHLGPTAQDFRRAFGLGDSDRTIGMQDADGVALAAIQGLNEKLDAENRALREQLASLRQQQAALKARLDRLAPR